MPELRTESERNQECVMGSEGGTYVGLSSWRHTVALESDRKQP
jgi:hypothetical protein